MPCNYYWYDTACLLLIVPGTLLHHAAAVDGLPVLDCCMADPAASSGSNNRWKWRPATMTTDNREIRVDKFCLLYTAVLSLLLHYILTFWDVLFFRKKSLQLRKCKYQTSLFHKFASKCYVFRTTYSLLWNTEPGCGKTTWNFSFTGICHWQKDWRVLVWVWTVFRRVWTFRPIISQVKFMFYFDGGGNISESLRLNRETRCPHTKSV